MLPLEAILEMNWRKEYTDPTSEYEALAKEAGMTPDAANALMARARARLKAFRDQRPRPMLDDKIIAGWNGLMISGMVRGGRCLDDGAYIKAASHAAEFYLEIYDPVSILHRIHRNDRSTTEGFLDDYVYLICGLLDLLNDLSKTMAPVGREAAEQTG